MSKTAIFNKFNAEIDTVLEIAKRETRTLTSKQGKDAIMLTANYCNEIDKITVKSTNEAIQQCASKIDTMQTKIEAGAIKNTLMQNFNEASAKINSLEKELEKMGNDMKEQEVRLKRVESWYNQTWLTGNSATITNSSNLNTQSPFSASPTSGASQNTATSNNATSLSVTHTAATSASGTGVISMTQPSVLAGGVAAQKTTTGNAKMVNMVQQVEKLLGEKFLNDYTITSDQSFKEWAQRFKDVIVASGTTDLDKQLALLKLKLNGWARQRFEELTAAEKADLDQAIAALTTKFDSGEAHHIAMARLKTFMPMIQGQSVMSYAENLEKLVLKALAGGTPQVQQARLLEEFLDRLPFNMAFYVKDKAPTNFQDALGHARKYEALWMTPSVPGAQNVNAILNAEIEHLKDQVKDLKTTNNNFSQSRKPQPFDRSKAKCYNCGEMGHFSRDCYRQRNFINKRTERRQQQPWQTKTLEDDMLELKNQMAQLSALLKNKPGVNSLSFKEEEKSESLPNLKILEKTSQHVDVPKQKLVVINDHKNGEESRPETAVAVNNSVSISEPGVHVSLKKFNAAPLTVMLIFALITGTFANPLLCQKGVPSMILSLPEKLQCNAEFALLEEPKEVKISIFQPNAGLHETKAYHCRIFEQDIAYYTTLENEDRQTPTFIEKEVSIEACKRMINKKTCELGDLKERSHFWSTDFKAKLNFGWPVFSSFHYRHAKVENCLFAETTIFTKNANKTMTSPLADLSECDYKLGHCQLPDKSMLVWEPQPYFCKTNFWNTLNGFVNEKLSWVSESGEFALTFKDPKIFTDCSEKLVESDQGYSISLSHFEDLKSAKRSKREGGVGIVTTNQLAATMQAMVGAAQRMLTERFVHLHGDDCASLQAIWASFRTIAMLRPTQAIRGLLQRKDIQVKVLTQNLVEIFPCSMLKEEQWEIIGDSKCTKELPIFLKIGEQKRKVFLNVDTMIITENPLVVNCELIKDQYIELNEIFYKIDRISGKTQKISPAEWNPAMIIGNTTAGLPHHTQIFHNLVITTAEDLLPIHSFEAMMEQAHIEAAVQRHLQQTSVGVHIYDESGGIKEAATGWWGFWTFSFYDWWTLLCNLSITVIILRKVIIPCLVFVFLEKSSFNLLNRMWVTASALPVSQNNNNTASESVVSESLQSWPPKIIANINSYSNSTLPVCYGAINNAIKKVLIDSGSEINLINIDTAKSLNLYLEHIGANDVTTVLGNGVPMLGTTYAVLFVLGEVIVVDLFITSAPLPPQFDILLGTPALKSLPPICFDFQKELIICGKVWTSFVKPQIPQNNMIIANINAPKLPIIVGEMEGQLWNFLIDTGSQFNIMGAETANRNNIPIDYLEEAIILQNWAGETTLIIGTCEVEVGLEELPVNTVFHVCDREISWQFDAILGTPALQSLEITGMDFTNEVVFVQGRAIPFLESFDLGNNQI